LFVCFESTAGWRIRASQQGLMVQLLLRIVSTFMFHIGSKTGVDAHTAFSSTPAIRSFEQDIFETVEPTLIRR